MVQPPYEQRIARLREVMIARSVDAVLLSVGADLPYFTGYEAMPSERLTMMSIPREGDPSMVVPRLEAPRVEEGPFDLVVWDESDDPVDLIGTQLSGASRIAVGDHTWAVFVLRLLETLGRPELVPASDLTGGLRMRKDSEEIALLRNAAHGVDRAIERIPSEVPFAGRTEAEISRQLQQLTVDEGHDSAAHAIVGSGPNGASPHHEPGDRVVVPGDVVVCDFGGRLGGYYSDCTRTFVVGEPTSRHVEVHALVEASNAAGRAAVSPGVPCEDVDRAARRVIADAGFGANFVHRTGHGIGLEVHEHPYMVEGNSLPLEEGMTFSVEPGIYLPGEFGVRIEDIVVCGPEGADSLNLAPRKLIEVA